MKKWILPTVVAFNTIYMFSIASDLERYREIDGDYSYGNALELMVTRNTIRNDFCYLDQRLENLETYHAGDLCIMSHSKSLHEYRDALFKIAWKNGCCDEWIDEWILEMLEQTVKDPLEDSAREMQDCGRD